MQYVALYLLKQQHQINAVRSPVLTVSNNTTNMEYVALYFLLLTLAYTYSMKPYTYSY